MKFPVLKGHMAAKKVSVKKIARLLDLTTVAVYLKLEGKNEFKLSEMKKIQAALGTTETLDILFFNEGERK